MNLTIYSIGFISSLQLMAFGDTGEHGQAAARPVLAAKRFVIENVIVQLEIMVEKHVLVLNKTMALAINNPAPVKKIV